MTLGSRIWRIGADTAAYEADDLSGRGAELYRGRWNEKGTPMVYASTSRALACLETSAHLTAGVPLPLNRYLVEISFPVASWLAAERAPLTVGWDAIPEGRVSISWGTDWAARCRSLLAIVPSVIVPEEENVLINPRHPDIGLVKAEKIRKWQYDARRPA